MSELADTYRRMFRNVPVDVVDEKPVCRLCGYVWDGSASAAEEYMLPHLKQKHGIDPWADN